MRSENMRSSTSWSSTRLSVCQSAAPSLRRGSRRGATSSCTLSISSLANDRWKVFILRRRSICAESSRSRSMMRVADCAWLPSPDATRSATAWAVAFTWAMAASRALGNRESVGFIGGGATTQQLRSSRRDYRCLKYGPNGPAVGGRAGGFHRFFSESRISRNRATSSGGAGGAGGVSWRRRLICRTIRKMMSARIRKLTSTVRKLP